MSDDYDGKVTVEFPGGQFTVTRADPHIRVSGSIAAMWSVPPFNEVVVRDGILDLAGQVRYRLVEFDRESGTWRADRIDGQ